MPSRFSREYGWLVSFPALHGMPSSVKLLTPSSIVFDKLLQTISSMLAMSPKIPKSQGPWTSTVFSKILQCAPYPQILLSPVLCSTHLGPVPSGFILTQSLLALVSTQGVSPVAHWGHSLLSVGLMLSWPCYGRTLVQWVGPERAMCHLVGWRPVHLHENRAVANYSGPGSSQNSGNSRCPSVEVPFQSLRAPFFSIRTLDI